ncbi:NUDIX hydrolase [Streptomyces sp. NBC_01207]|uniref:NUDIX hydrolase n=1 Tax=Streptomyces sp. NBC_01207 TaxID=2903772 RepID=UPI002E131A08
MPGGHADAGEAPFVAAARELAEETGVHVPSAASTRSASGTRSAETRPARTSPSRKWSSSPTAPRPSPGTTPAPPAGGL